MFSHSDNLKLGSNARVRIPPPPPPPPPPPHRCISLVLSIEFSNRICNFLSFFFVFCRWNLSPSYPIKVNDLVARVLSHIFLSYYNIENRLRSDEGDGYEIVKNAYIIGLILRTTLHVHPLFCTFSLPSLHIYDVKMPNFMLYDEIFLILSERAYGSLKFNPSRAP